MDLLTSSIVLGAVVVASLSGAWALGRHKIRKDAQTNTLRRSDVDLESEDHKAREQLEDLLRNNPRIGGFG